MEKLRTIFKQRQETEKYPTVSIATCNTSGTVDTKMAKTLQVKQQFIMESIACTIHVYKLTNSIL